MTQFLKLILSVLMDPKFIRKISPLPPSRHQSLSLFPPCTIFSSALLQLPDQMMDTMGQMESICLLTYQDSTPLESRPKAEKDFRLLSVDLA